jgi:hypothetical protein
LENEGRIPFSDYILGLASLHTRQIGAIRFPYPGLSQRVAGHKIGLALLPVFWPGKGVAGNFTFAEGIELRYAEEIPYLIPHHFGMFTSNTIDREEVKAPLQKSLRPHSSCPTSIRCGS